MQRIAACLVALGCLWVGSPSLAWGSAAGTLTTVAGGMPSGAPRSIAQSPWALATGPDGALYTVDEARSLVEKVSPSGDEQVVAGTGANAVFGDGGPATSAGLESIRRIAVDANGNVLISGVDLTQDHDHHPKDAVVRVVAGADCAAGSCAFGFAGAMTKGSIYTLAGALGVTGSSDDDIPAIGAKLADPEGVAVDARGDLLIADAADGVVKLVAASACAAGSCPWGYQQAMKKGALYTIAQALGGPTGVALTARGDLVIADATGNDVALLMGSDCAAGSCPFGYPSGLAAGQVRRVATGLARPVGVKVSSRGDIVIAEQTGPDVAVVAGADCPAGSCPFGYTGAMTAGIRYTVAGTPGTAGISPDATPALSAKLSFPNDVAVGPAGDLVIADPGFGPFGNNQAELLMASSCAAGSCPFGYPGALARGDMARLAGTGTYDGYLGEGLPAAGIAVNLPFAVTANRRGDVIFSYYAENLVRMVAGADCAAGSCPFGFAGPMTRGHIYTVAGKLNAITTLSPDGTAATDASVIGPTGIAVDARGDLLFAEAGNQVVQLLAASDCAAGSCPFGFAGAMTKGHVYTIAGTGQYGVPANDAVATGTTLAFPLGIAIDEAGDLVIAAYADNAVELVAGANCAAGSCPLGFPGAMTKGHMYAVAGTPGAAGVTPDGGEAAGGQLGGPQAVAIDPGGNLLIADHALSAVRLVAATDCAASCPFAFPNAMQRGAIYTIAGSPGTPGISPNGTPARSARIGGVSGLAVDAAGNLLISDDVNAVVWSVAGSDCAAYACRYGFPSAMTKGGVYAIAGTPGSVGYSPDGTPAGSAKLGAGQSVAIDPDGNLLIADSGNGRIYRLGKDALPPPLQGGTEEPGGSGPGPGGSTPGGSDPAGGFGPGGSDQPDGSAADRTPPSISALSLTNRTFAASRAVTAATATKKAELGTTIGFHLSEAATVVFVVRQHAPGRLSRMRCVAATKKLIKAKAKRCVLTTTIGTFSRQLAAGAAKVSFTGRLKRGALKPGSYVLSLTATDAANNRSKPATTTFNIIKPRPRASG